MAKKNNAGENIDDLGGIKKKILRWCKSHTVKRGLPVHNLTDSFADGKAFLAILNDIDNHGSPYAPSNDDPCANFRVAFADADVKYGIPQMLNPEDAECVYDEISMLTYLADCMEKMPDSVPQPDPYVEIDKWVTGHASELEAALLALCRCESTPENAAGRGEALEVVKKEFAAADMVVDKQGDDILVLSSSSGGEDPSKPTVLLYATTGVDKADSEAWRAAVGSGPFDCLKSATGARLFAAGARGDKAGVIAPLFAMKALRANGVTPKCNVKVYVGSSTDGSEAIEASSELAADYVVVSEAGAKGAFASMEKDLPALLSGCRGWLKVTVSSSQAEDLVLKLGQLRDAATAALCVEDMLPAPRVEAFKDGFFEHLRPEGTQELVEALVAEAGYGEDVLTAPEFNGICDGKYTQRGLPAAAALALESALFVDKLCTSNETAYATLHAMVPPGFTDLDKAADRIAAALQVQLESFQGQAGYVAESRQPFAAALKASLAQAFDGQKVASGMSPAYSPVAAAFAKKLPEAAVFQFGAPTIADKVGCAGESVAIVDVVNQTKALCRLLNEHMDGVPKESPRVDEPSCPLKDLTMPPKILAVPSLSADKPPASKPVPSKPVPSSTLPSPPPPPPSKPEPPQQEPVPPKVVAEKEEKPPVVAAKVPSEPPKLPVSIAKAPRPAASEEQTAQKPSLPSRQAPEPPARSAPKSESPAPETPETPSPPPAESKTPPLPPKTLLTAEGLVEEINKLRANPPAYIAVLESMLGLYKEDKSFWPSEANAQPFMTHEGAAAVKDAIEALGSQKELHSLKLREGMSLAAVEHAEDLVRSGERLGHTGSDGSKPADRLTRHGRWFERASECLAYRHLSAPMLVAQLVIDDGMKSRTQRNTILSPEMRAIGAAVVDHPQHGVLAVVTLAGGFGPHPLEEAKTVVCASAYPNPDFTEVLDSIPVFAVHEQVELALQRKDKVELAYEPGSLKMTIWQQDGTGQMYGVEWEH